MKQGLEKKKLKENFSKEILNFFKKKIKKRYKK